MSGDVHGALHARHTNLAKINRRNDRRQSAVLIAGCPAVPADSLGFSPDSRSFVLAEELDVDHVGVAADRAVFDVLLFRSTAGVERDHDLLTAGGAHVGPL